jgi:hypothetical protein
LLAHQDLRNLKTTSQGAGYQANSVMESFCADTQESISHLASAASSDRSTIQAILDTNKVLREQISALTKELSSIRDTMNKKGRLLTVITTTTATTKTAPARNDTRTPIIVGPTDLTATIATPALLARIRKSATRRTRPRTIP